jgi:ATP-dependent DNA helicase Rep
MVEALGYRHHLRMLVEDPLELTARLGVVDDVIEMARSHGASGSDAVGSFLDALALRTDAENDRDEDERPAVTLLTMHAAKGLEFPWVAIVGVEEGLLPHGKVVADDEDGDGGGTPAVEEERRLFYVGMTRAKRSLLLTWAQKRSSRGRDVPRKPSRFLDEIGDAHLERVAPDQGPATPEEGKAWLAAIRSRLQGGGFAVP